MKSGGLVGRLTLSVGVLTSGIVILVALAIGALVYVQTERSIQKDLSRAAASIIRDELTSVNGRVGLQKKDDGKSLADLLRNLDISLYVADASGSALASYGIYRTVGSVDRQTLLQGVSVASVVRPIYTDKNLSQIGTVDTYTVPLREAHRTVGILQLTRINNMWPIIGKSLFFSLLFMIPVIWGIAFWGSRWGTARTLAPLSELVSSVSTLDIDQLPEKLPTPHAMDNDVRTLYQTLQILIERVRSSLQRQREISENVSHEFKTPLTRITSQLAVLSSSLTVKQQELLNPAIRELVDLGEQVDGLLDVAVYGSFQGSGSPFHLKPFLAEIVSHIPGGKERIHLSFSDSIELRIPQGHARIICRNLLENAVKYSIQGADIRVEADQTGDRWTIRFINHAQSDGSHEAHLFTRKVRGDSARAHGYGLGLAIVKDVSKQLGLTIEYTRNHTEFTVTLSNKW